MRSHFRVCLSALMVIIACVMIPAATIAAQPTAGAPASANALDHLTGPIALYPDALVVHILNASTNHGTVVSFASWLQKNSSLKGTGLQEAAQKAGFSESLVALASFPQVVKMMAEKPDWTKALGQAVTADKKGVGDSIQRLRGQAMAAGNLKTTPQQTVTVTNTVVERTIEQQVVVVTNTIVQIQPANPQVIYVPQYNPTVVYVDDDDDEAAAMLIGFTTGVIVAGAWHNHYDYHDYWDDREDYYEDRADDARENQDQRQTDRQSNQDQRQADREGNQEQRQSGSASAQSQGAQQKAAAPTAQNQGAQRQTAPTAQAQGAQQKAPAPAAQPQAAQRQTAPAPSSAGAGQSASRSSGMNSGGASGYQSGSATRSQSSRGSTSVSSSRGGGGARGGGGGRGGGGRR